MKKLENYIPVNNIGIAGLFATLIERIGDIAIYLRDDDIYETGIVKVALAEKIFGKEYPKRELYFSNEDFGSTAYTSNSLKRSFFHMKLLQKRNRK